MDVESSFGRWVKQRRKALDLTQHELARRVGCALSTIQKIEIDERQPSRQMAELLAHHLDLPPAERAAFLHLARSRSMPAPPILPVLPSPHRPFNNLPSPLTSLVGREWEVTTLCARLLEADVRLLTITGPPGVGKTRLALRVAQTILECGFEILSSDATTLTPPKSQITNPQFPDGVCFVALAPITEARFVIPATARALGVEDTGGQPLLERVKAQLRNQHFLLVLDNFEHVRSAAPSVVELLEAAPHLKILTTSRAILQVYGEHEFVAPPLSLPELKRLPTPDQMMHYAAVELFVQRARAFQQEFHLSAANAHTVAEICVRLEGLPLAIELAAARIKLFSPQTLLARLTGALAPQLDLLTGAQYQTARHRTLRAAIAWSYDLLNPTEQTLFRCLGVFAGGFTLDAVSSVISEQLSVGSEQSARMTDKWLQITVQSLVNHSLVMWQPEASGERRYALLEMMREYALEQLEQHGETKSARRGHALYFLQLAEKHHAVASDVKGNVVELVAQMEREIDNLRTALSWAAQHDPELELRLIIAMTQFWAVRSHMSEGRQWLEQLLPRLQSQASQFQPEQMVRYTRIHFMLAFFTWLQGDFVLAQSRLEENAALARQVQDWETTGSALQFLALTFYDRGDYPAACALALESVKLQRQFGDPWHLGIALTNLGVIMVANGDQTMARTLHEEALAIFHELGNTWGVKLTLLGLSEVYIDQGDDERARTCLEDALQTFREEKQSWFVAQTLLYLGKVQWRNHAQEAAVASWDESIALAREAGAKRYLAEALFMSGFAAQLGDDLPRARAFFTESLLLYRQIENPIGAAYALAGLAGISSSPLRRTQLLAAAASVLDKARMPMDQIEHAQYEATVAAVRAQLADATLAAAWEQGSAMSTDEAIALALADDQDTVRRGIGPSQGESRSHTAAPTAYRPANPDM